MKSPVETVIDLMNETSEQTAERRMAADERREAARIENLEYRDECRAENHSDNAAEELRDSDLI